MHVYPGLRVRLQAVLREFARAECDLRRGAAQWIAIDIYIVEDVVWLDLLLLFVGVDLEARVPEADIVNRRLVLAERLARNVAAGLERLQIDVLQIEGGARAIDIALNVRLF